MTVIELVALTITAVVNTFAVRQLLTVVAPDPAPVQP
ncbi:hypothetical protein CFREI_13750 (plasmid) [Corynebacterium freiburgense]|nr:hypothetical protein CFREI_11000 [Corynebacterium freiburgense]WJZ03579.1 hypothetical protein CFREI_11600 [Corynebacterium freiburgense]WJZ03996.1 hypothetical protein CFREI_13750 [Corynebacterium freiburgense]